MKSSPIAPLTTIANLQPLVNCEMGERKTVYPRMRSALVPQLLAPLEVVY